MPGSGNCPDPEQLSPGRDRSGQQRCADCAPARAGAAVFEQLGAGVQRAALRPVAKSPAAELREHGYELARGFGQAVTRPLAGSGFLTGEESRLD
jgi:hypothetical protein